MNIGKRKSLALIAASGFALLLLHAPYALGKGPTGAATCTVSAPVTARPSGPVEITWKTTNQPASTSVALDGAAIGSNLPAEQAGINITAPERYGTHLVALTVANTFGTSTCSAEIFVAAQTTVAVPPNTFTWVYSPRENGFTDAEIRHLAENYTYIVLTRQHGGFNIDRRHIDAKKIKALNSKVKLFSYYSMTARLRRESIGDRDHPPAFDRAWLLRDASGRDIPFKHQSSTIGHFINIADPDYRAWLQATFHDWFRKAPYDGIAFDNSILVADATHRRRELVGVDLSADTVRRYNDAMRGILSESKQASPDKSSRKEVIFNGVAPTASRLDRSLDLLNYGDVALNEQFCITPRGGKFWMRNQLKEDIDLMARGAKVQQLVKYRPRDAATSADQAARFCYGVFMMGYQPGSDFFKFRDDSRDDPRDIRYQNRIYGNAAEIRVNLGDPAEHYADGEIWTRKFRRGVVYVNPDDIPRTVILDQDAVLMNGSKAGATYKSGASIPLVGRDALFLTYVQHPGSVSAQ